MDPAELILGEADPAVFSGGFAGAQDLHRALYADPQLSFSGERGAAGFMPLGALEDMINDDGKFTRR